MVCLVLVSFCAWIATIAAISTIVHNFQTNISSILVAMMIAYYMVAPYFEKWVRDGFFHEKSYFVNILIMALIQCTTYISAIFVLKRHSLTYELRKVSAVIDRFGISIFILIECVFLVVIYFTCIVAEKWKIGIAFMIGLIIANFLTFIVIVLLINRSIQNRTEETELESDIAVETSIFDSLTNLNVYWLLLSTFVVVGAGTAFELEVPTVAFAMDEPESWSHVMKLYWISDASSRLWGGLIAAFLFKVAYKYLLWSILSLWAMLGFSIALLSESCGIAFFFISSILIGASVGGFWVVLPQVILADMNKNSFEIIWGFVININLIGVFVFDKIFMYVDDKKEPLEIGTCQGIECYLTSYILSSALWAIVGAILLFCYINHIKIKEESMEPLRERKQPDSTQ